MDAVELASGDLFAAVMPAAGLSLVSFKHRGREFLDLWDLGAFIGNEADLEHVSKDTTDTFRKGFGPGIGPWFGGRAEGDKAWHHGVCRFADWRGRVAVEKNRITGRLDGARSRLLGKTLDQICGFHLDVKISYALENGELVYRVRNYSEKSLGTYGIHWYWPNPPDTRVRLKTTDDEIRLAVGEPGVRRFEIPALGLNDWKARVEYADGSGLSFRVSDTFRHITIFSTDRSLCMEPLSGPPGPAGTFTQGEIRIGPLP